MLTHKQLQLLDFINQRVQRDGVPPSFDEMKDSLSLRSKSGIHRLITALEERGFIRRLAHRARAIEIVKLPEQLGGKSEVNNVSRVAKRSAENVTELKPAAAEPATHYELPLLGRIAAGRPIEAVFDEHQHISVPPSMITSASNHFALEVKGDSMINAGINNGDVVIIRETSHAQNGDIVVAQIEGYEATLKRFRRRDNMIALEAENPAVQTRLLPEGQVKVQGKLVGLIRTY